MCTVYILYIYRPHISLDVFLELTYEHLSSGSYGFYCLTAIKWQFHAPLNHSPHSRVGVSLVFCFVLPRMPLQLFLLKNNPQKKNLKSKIVALIEVEACTKDLT